MATTSLERSRFTIKRRSDRGSTDENSVRMEIRRHLINREERFAVTADVPADRTAETALAYVQEACAIRMPFVSDDFDYLYRNIRQTGCMVRIEPQQTLLQYEVLYYTTLAQERYIAQRTDQILRELPAGRSDLLKATAVYDYIISHVTYDDTHTMHSAYDALYRGQAVCSGCAVLLYRLLSASNIPCRIVTGTALGERHSWNIAKIGRRWYNLDVTWDLAYRQRERTLTSYRWFLRGSEAFAGHIRDASYSNGDFYSRYPISQVDYYAQAVGPRL